MPHRLLIYLYQIEWVVLISSITAAIAIPFLDLAARFFIPIISGIVWLFLKPCIVRLKDKVNIFKK